MGRGSEVTSNEELERELHRLFESAFRGGVKLGEVSTFVCRPVLAKTLTTAESEKDHAGGELGIRQQNRRFSASSFLPVNRRLV